MYFSALSDGVPASDNWSDIDNDLDNTDQSKLINSNNY